jgi:hypothetical protein
MRRPTYASVLISTRLRPLRWGYDKPIKSRCYPGMFYTQGSTWFEFGPVHIVIVWTNR